MRYEDVKIGQRVTITGAWPTRHDGWDNSWAEGMDSHIGRTYTVCRVDRAGIHFDEIGYGWPWQVLELEGTGGTTHSATRYVKQHDLKVRIHLQLMAGCSPHTWRFQRYLDRGWSRNSLNVDRITRYKYEGRQMAALIKIYRHGDDAAKFAALHALYIAMNYAASISRLPEAILDAYRRYDACVGKLSNEWHNTPWANEPWYADSPHAPRLCHISVEDPTMVAYHESFDKFLRDIQTRCKPGRFLTKYFSDTLSPEQIRKWAERVQMEHEAKGMLRFVESDNPDGWERIYEHGHGFSSCMVFNHPGTRHLDERCHDAHHPARVYARPGNGLRLAYLGTSLDAEVMQVYARCIVCDEPKKGYVRTYGDSRIQAFLERAGYTERVTLKGVALNKTWLSGNTYVMPYLDGVAYVDDGGDHFLATHSGDYDAQNASGVLCLDGAGERHYCECGAAWDDEDDIHYSEYEEVSYCESCEDNFVRAVVSINHYGAEHDMVFTSNATEVRYTWYVDDHDLLRQAGFILCESCDEWVPLDDTVNTSRGPICSDCETVELAVADPEGNTYAHPNDTKLALTPDGEEVCIHDDTEYDDDYLSPETAVEPDAHQQHLFEAA